MSYQLLGDLAVCLNYHLYTLWSLTRDNCGVDAFKEKATDLIKKYAEDEGKRLEFCKDAFLEEMYQTMERLSRDELKVLAGFCR